MYRRRRFWYVKEKTSRRSSARGSQKNELAKSMQENHRCSGMRDDRAVYGLGTGTVGVAVTALILLKSCAMWYLPVCCFSTGRMGVFQADAELSNTPTFIRPSIVSRMPSSAAGLSLY